MIGRSEGSRLLGKLERTREELGGVVGVSHQSISGWISGSKSPAVHRREAIERELGIPVEAWELPPSSSSSPSPASRSRGTGPRTRRPAATAQTSTTVPNAAPRAAHAGPPRSAHEAALEHLADVEAALARVSSSGTASPRELAALFSSRSGAIAALAKCEPDDEAKCSRDPRWLRLRDRVVAALSPHPAALAAVVAALEVEP